MNSEQNGKRHIVRGTRYIGSFPADEEVLSTRFFEGDFLIATNKAFYRIPAKTLPLLGIHPIRSWEPFRLRPAS